MARAPRTSLILGCFLLIAPLYTYGTSPLPMLFPESEEMVVQLHNSFSIRCSGESELNWHYPTKEDGDDNVDIRHEENNSGLFVSVLEVKNASSYHTGVYTCYYNQTQTDDFELEGMDKYIYVPDPTVPFVPSTTFDHIIVVEEDESAIVPCRTTDPNSQVTLRNKDMEKNVNAFYDSKQGFVGNFESGVYICETMVNGVLFKTDDYNLQTWKASNNLAVEMQAQKTVFRTGETIIISCIVLENEVVDLQWNYPGKQSTYCNCREKLVL